MSFHLSFMPIFLTIFLYLQTSHSFKHTDKPVTFYKRNFSDTAKCRFIACLQQTDWRTLVKDQPIESGYDSFETTYLSIFDNCFSLLKYNRNHQKCYRKPWMTNGLLRCCLKKDKLYKRFKTNPIAVNESKYKKYRNKLNKLNRIRERVLYFKI